VSIAGGVARVFVVAVAAMFVMLLGSLFRVDVATPSARLDAAIVRSGAALDACKSVVRPEARPALRIYLAIEEFFRPAYLRVGEFIGARIGAWVGLEVVNTLGIGQISRKTYLAVADDGRLGSGGEQEWLARLQDDCANIAVLQLYADKNDVSCSENPTQCMVLLACFWHTGRADSCAMRKGDISYLANLLTTSERADLLDLKSAPSSRGSDPSRDRGRQLRSGAWQWEQKQPR
jgi:hypothetical protein